MSSARPKILAFAGSTRKDSWNKKLLKEAAEGAFGEGAEVTFLDLADYPIPLYDGDLEAEQGVPANVKKLQELFGAHDGFLIASPEYNGSYSAVLKNVFDWVSRAQDASPPPFREKVAAIVAAAPGNFGGVRGLDKLRDLLDHLQVIVLPEIYVVRSVGAAFNEAGKLKDEKAAKAVKNIGAKLARTLKKFTP